MKQIKISKKLLFLLFLLPTSIILLFLAIISSLSSDEKYTPVNILSENKYDYLMKSPETGDVLLYLEKASNEEEYKTGLMNRKSLDQNSGMIFLFPDSQIRTFWMKNTYIPLDIAFLDQGYTIINIEENAKPLDTSVRYTSSRPAQYVIETNAGWFKQNNISQGDTLTITSK